MRNIVYHITNRGIALLPTLVLLAILSVMVTVAARVNITRRTALREQKIQLDSLYLAESGIQLALHKMPSQASGEISDTKEQSVCIVKWSSKEGGFTDIVSTGAARVDLPGAPQRTVRVRASTKDNAAKTLLWSTD